MGSSDLEGWGSIPPLPPCYPCHLGLPVRVRGVVEMSDVAWFCNRCKNQNGSRFENRGFRKSCHKCQRSKGVAHFGDVPPRVPAVGRGGGPPAGAGAKQSRDKGVRDKGADDRMAKRTKELEKEVRELRAKLAEGASARRAASPAPSGDGGESDEMGDVSSSAETDVFSVDQLWQQKQQLLKQGAREDHPLVLAAHARWQARKSAEDASKKPEVRLQHIHTREQILEKQVARATRAVANLEAERRKLDDRLAEARLFLERRQAEAREVQEDKKRVATELAALPGGEQKGGGVPANLLDAVRSLPCDGLGDDWGSVLESILVQLYAAKGLQQRLYGENEIPQQPGGATVVGSVAGGGGVESGGAPRAFPVPSGAGAARGPWTKRRGVDSVVAGLRADGTRSDGAGVGLVDGGGDDDLSVASSGIGDGTADVSANMG